MSIVSAIPPPPPILTIPDRLDYVFENRSADGFVNLTQIHRIVTPNDKRGDAKLLGPKKLTESIAALKTPTFDPLRHEGHETHAFWTLALDVIVYRKKDLHPFARKWRTLIDNPMRDLLLAEDSLNEHIQRVFGNEGIRYIKLNDKFYFSAPDLVRLILNGDNDGSRVYLQRARAHDSQLNTLLEKVYTFRYVLIFSVAVTN